MSFTFIPMLLAGKSISREAKQALLENRLEDAAVLMMKEHGLSCLEVGDLLNTSICRESSADFTGA